jgi:hypothetical protein
MTELSQNSSSVEQEIETILRENCHTVQEVSVEEDGDYYYQMTAEEISADKQ